MYAEELQNSSVIFLECIFTVNCKRLVTLSSVNVLQEVSKFYAYPFE